MLAVAFMLLDHPDPAAGQPRADRGAGLVQIEQDGLLFTYHVVSGTEALFDVRADPQLLRNLLPQRREDGIRLHRALERQLRIDSLETLREGRRDEILLLNSLGYL